MVDLASLEGRQHEGIAAADLGCAWKLLAFEGEPVPSWALARRLIGAGTAAILVPSFAPGATDDDVNLVLWRWGPDLPHRVTLNDPDRRLPRDARSWT